MLPAHDRPGLSSLGRAVAVLAVPALVLSACSGTGKPASLPSASSSVTGNASPSSTVSVPAGVALTAQGSKLSFGRSARVIYEPTRSTGTVLELTVKDARHAARRDFKDFILDDSYKKQAHYYYVDVRVANVGKSDVGGSAIPLWGVDGHNTLLPAVSFTTPFKPCPSKPLPNKFGPGDSVSTCLVYLSPRHGSLAAVSFRPDQAFNPITWTGAVASPSLPPKPKHHHHKPKHHH